VASGTAGALLGLPLVWALSPLPLGGRIAASAALALICIPVCTVAEGALGGEKDDGRIVADEYLTFPICMLGLPWLEPGNWWVMPMAFVVNRFMDIVKPFPAYRLQALKGGLGITVDDIVASLYALGANWLLTLHVVPRLLARLGS
jgi:phosphatidylglycerophosphatase A